MTKIISYILIPIMAITGSVTTIYVLVAIPATIIWKIYRKLVHGKKLTD